MIIGLLVAVSLTGAEPNFMYHRNFNNKDECLTEMHRIVDTKPKDSPFILATFCVDEQDLLEYDKA